MLKRIFNRFNSFLFIKTLNEPRTPLPRAVKCAGLLLLNVYGLSPSLPWTHPALFLLADFSLTPSNGLDGLCLMLFTWQGGGKLNYQTG